MQNKKSILIVEDERDLSDVVCFNLEREGYRCQCVGDGKTALASVLQEPPDLIVLDRMLPELSGDAVASALRRDPKSESIPIIMLTAKSQETDQLIGFALGVDDYITKPFSMKALMARIGAVLRRATGSHTREEAIVAGPFRLDPSRHLVTVNDERADLTATEFRILRTLMKADGRVLNRGQLIDAVLGTTVAVTDRTIDVHITALRRKVRLAGRDDRAEDWIQTIRGVGYAFRKPE